ncbi:MAG: XdhC family protein [Desulfovibrionaceae bacterium]|nr:XdhC family protein [Desulfovibrionaceae bacterium]
MPERDHSGMDGFGPNSCIGPVTAWPDEQTLGRFAEGPANAASAGPDRLDMTPPAPESDPESALESPTEVPDAGQAAGPAEAPAPKPLPDGPVLLLCGSGPEAQATAELAWQCGFTVDVVDEAGDTLGGPALESAFPRARQCLRIPGFDDLVEACGIGQKHLVAIMTEDRDTSCHLLSQALESHAAYIGMLGGRRKRAYVYEILRERGVPRAELAVIRCPIGLSVGAAGPQQMAVAIVAELLAARAGTLQRLRLEDSLTSDFGQG